MARCLCAFQGWSQFSFHTHTITLDINTMSIHKAGNHDSEMETRPTVFEQIKFTDDAMSTRTLVCIFVIGVVFGATANAAWHVLRSPALGRSDGMDPTRAALVELFLLSQRNIMEIKNILTTLPDIQPPSVSHDIPRAVSSDSQTPD